MLVGSYEAVAIDNAGNNVTTSLQVDGGQIVQSVTPAQSTDYPVTVIPAFAAANPAAAIAEIYPEIEIFQKEVPDATNRRSWRPWMRRLTSSSAI